MYGSELKQYEFYKHIATASYTTVIDSMRLFRLKLCNESMRWGHFSIEKRTLFLHLPFSLKYDKKPSCG